jgi:hypothetical protein
MKIAILTANLGNFDMPVDPIPQDLPNEVQAVDFRRFTDENFPPVTGLTPRFQYRIPKLFGWQMFPGYDYYIWLDGSVSLQDKTSLKWFLDHCKEHDMAVFRHPWRKTIKEEADFITEKLETGNKYITSRYKNGFHNEQLKLCLADPNFRDTNLDTSTAFIYRNSDKVHEFMDMWWYFQSRYFTCDQIVLPYVIFKNKLNIKVIEEDQYNIPYLTLVSKHK